MSTGKAILGAMALYLAHGILETHWVHPTPRPKKGQEIRLSMSTTGKEATNMRGKVFRVHGRWVQIGGRLRGEKTIWLDWSRVVHWSYAAE